MDELSRRLHPVYMSGQRHFLRAWRKHKGYTLEQVAERIGTTHATLSRVERGLVPYNQTLLELLAAVYSTEPGSLVMRDPNAKIWTIGDNLTVVESQQVEAFLEAVRKAS